LLEQDLFFFAEFQETDKDKHGLRLRFGKAGEFPSVILLGGSLIVATCQFYLSTNLHKVLLALLLGLDFPHQPL
jgi:hypothetical protein